MLHEDSLWLLRVIVLNTDLGLEVSDDDQDEILDEQMYECDFHDHQLFVQIEAFIRVRLPTCLVVISHQKE